MAYRKLKATQIFDGRQLLKNHVLVVTNTGVIIDIIEYDSNDAEVEYFDGIICPGFVNAHCHLELSHLKNKVPENTGMVDFLIKILFDRAAEPDVKQSAMQTAASAMLKDGIVAVGDISNTVDSISVKAENVDLYFHNFIEVSGFTPATASIRFEQAMEVRNAFSKSFPVEQISITPHAPYSVSENLFQLIAGQQQDLISIHSQESKAESDFIKNHSGEMLKLYNAIGVSVDFFEPKNTSSLQYMLPLLTQNTNIILVHNCLTNQQRT